MLTYSSVLEFAIGVVSIIFVPCFTWLDESPLNTSLNAREWYAVPKSHTLVYNTAIAVNPTDPAPASAMEFAARPININVITLFESVYISRLTFRC